MGLHNSITYSFLPVGHTKFSPDWCFGILKQKLRRTKIDNLDDLKTAVEKSATVNLAQLVGAQNSDVIVPHYNWHDSLSQIFTKMPNIKKLHQFHIKRDISGLPTLNVSKFSDTPSHVMNILKEGACNYSIQFTTTLQIHSSLALSTSWSCKSVACSEFVAKVSQDR